MKPTSLYRNNQAGPRMAGLTQAIAARMNTTFTERDIDTSFARTRVVEGGNREAPPLVVLHGGGANSYLALGFVHGQLDAFHVYGIDTPGQPGGSEEVFIDPRGNDNGHWLAEVMDGLELPSARFLSISWGGFLLQRLAAVAPERIEKAAMLVPAGVINPPFIPMLRDFLIPRTLSRLTGRPANLDRLFKALFTDLDDPEAREFFAIFFTDCNADVRPMKRATPEEMAGFTAPKLIIGADEDICFPGEPLRKRCREVFPEPLEFKMLSNSKHSPSMKEEALNALVREIGEFLNPS